LNGRSAYKIALVFLTPMDWSGLMAAVGC
jgi:hypothetical protein